MRKRRGGTLIELLVALLLLDLALLSLATVGAVTVKRIGDANRRARAAMAAANRVERISTAPCTLAGSGSRTLEFGVAETWTSERRGRLLDIVDSIEVSPTREQIVVRRRIPCS
jgi:Tfp pilus assembly protein PilV